MPICTHCTHSVPSLYTVYASASNLRLEPCPACRAFADPYVEHDALTLFIDLILLKRDVYRHLLFNRGLGARKVSEVADGVDALREEAETRRRWKQVRRYLILKLGLVLVAIDALIRWTYLRPPLARTLEVPRNQEGDPWSEEAALSFLRIFAGCAIETLAFHAGITVASFVVLSILSLVRKAITSQQTTEPTAHDQFHYAQIPLTLLYSSLPKLFLLSLLSLWRPNMSRLDPLTDDAQVTGAALINEALAQGSLRPLANILDDDVLDREWVVRNVLGGMAAGFGLRVVLDCHPVFTSVVIVIGWALKTFVSALISGWVGGDSDRGQAWFAYSIP